MNVIKEKDYVIYNLFEDDIVRFAKSNLIIIYGDIDEARKDVISLGAGYFAHRAIDALPHHKLEIQKQINESERVNKAATN